MKKKVCSVLIIGTILLTTALSVMPTVQLNADAHDDELGLISTSTDRHA